MLKINIKFKQPLSKKNPASNETGFIYFKIKFILLLYYYVLLPTSEWKLIPSPTSQKSVTEAR
ncbi:hypothetical protein AB671_00753 [Chryseobacterium sp. BGARF1]|nr:hypothetical protein AB671_00753 [Chryseobacterium sp. BGARF1]